MLRSLGQSLLINGMIGLFMPQIDNWYVGGRPGIAGALPGLLVLLCGTRCTTQWRTCAND